MALTELQVKNLKPGDKNRKISDGKGLYLLLKPQGGKWWRFKYRRDGKENSLSLGIYPEVSLMRARERRDEARRQLAEGIDPSEARKQQSYEKKIHSQETLAKVSNRWIANHAEVWSTSYRQNIEGRLKRDIFPKLGSVPVKEISAPALLTVIIRIQDRGAIETAHRVLANCRSIFDFAIATGLLTSNPAQALKGALKKVKSQHLAAIIEPAQFGALLRALHGFQGTETVRVALKLAPMVFVRPGELRKAKWNDFNLDSAEWRFIATKTKTELIVPLARQAVELLRQYRPDPIRSEYVFSSQRSRLRPMSDNAVLSALRALGFAKEQVSGHGFRATARTLLAEELEFPVEWIEQQLAHQVRDPLGRAYNRTQYLDQRRVMMQKWADYLDELRLGTEAGTHRDH